MVTMAIASLWASMTAWFTPTILFCATNLIIATIFIASNNHTKHHHDHLHGEDHPPTKISRVSSFLDRARSFKFSTSNSYPHEHQHPPDSKTATFSSSSRLAQSIHSSVEPPSQLAHTLFQGSELYPTEPELEPPSQLAHTPSDSPDQLARHPSFIDRVKSFRLSSVFTQPETVGPDPGYNPEHQVTKSKSENKAVKKKSTVEMKKSRSEMRLKADEDEDEDDVDMRRPATARARVSGSGDYVDEEVDAKADDFISRFKQQLKLQRLESLVRYNQMLKRSS